MGNRRNGRRVLGNLCPYRDGYEYCFFQGYDDMCFARQLPTNGKKKQQEVTMKVEAAHSSGKFVGPIYYVTSPEKSSLHFKEVRCCYFYARDKVRFVLRSRKISLIFSLESV